MKIKNYTPHEIKIYDKNQAHYVPEKRKWFINENEKDNPIRVIPSDGILNAKIDYIETETLEGIPIYSPEVTNIDTPPENCYIVVSALYVQAAKILGIPTKRMLTVSQPVYEDENNPRPIGCLGLNKNQ